MNGTESTDRAAAIGRVAGLAIAVETTVFAASLIWEAASRSILATTLGYLASLLIAPSVVVLMACFYQRTSGQGRIFGLLALVASILYAPLCISTYFLQLTVVALKPDLSGPALELITFTPGSPTFALDMLGYGFLCLSTFAAGFALNGVRERVLRVLCFVHGALVIPSIASPIMSRIFLSSSGEADNTGNYVLILWCVVFVPIALLFARFFAGQQEEARRRRI